MTTKTASRQKQVFADEREIAHLWFSQAQESARNRQGNFYYTGDTIYSYGNHFPIARIVTVDKGPNKGKQAVLETVRTYGPATGRHQSVVHSAIRVWDGNKWDATPDKPIFRVTDPSARSERVLEDWTKRIESARVELVDVPKGTRQATKVKLFDALVGLIGQANGYAEYFGEKQRWSIPESIEATRAAMEVERAKTAAADERKRKAEIRKNAAYYKAVRGKLLDGWLKGGMGYDPNEQLPYNGLPRLDVRRLPEAYLRLTTSGDRGLSPDGVETSQGARVPLEHVQKCLPIVLTLIRNGRTYQRNGHSIHLGPYVLDSIDEKGNVKIGCHYFNRPEVKRFAGIIQSIPETSEVSEVQE